MKRQILLLTFLFISLCLAGQKKEKFGDVKLEELTMKDYSSEPGAPAVVLYEEKETAYDYSSHKGMIVKNRYFVRIKILTEKGLEYANQSIDYYFDNNNTSSERVYGLSGNTYNLVNGKIEKVNLSKESIFEEKVSDNLQRMKFAFSNVKPGSVIEYKYEQTSPQDGYLDDCIFQRSIPVVYSKYYLIIPEYYSFNKETKGMEDIVTSHSTGTQTLMVDGSSLRCTTNNYLFEVNNLQSIKDEDYVWCIKDFLTRVTFELRSFIITGIVYKDFSTSWGNADKQLLESNSFGKQLNHKLFKSELAGLLTADQTDIQKVQAIYYMIRSKVKWNEENTLLAKNPKEALKKGLGTSGEINALLISALREAGFDAYPVVMSLRYKGRIPITHPTTDNLNYFIAAVNIGENQVYMDASARYGDLNILPPAVMSDFARSIRENNRSEWVDLSNNNIKNTQVTSLILKFNESNALSGAVNQTYSGLSGYGFRYSISDHKDQQNFIEKKETENNMSISNFKVEGLDKTGERVVNSFDFTKNDIIAGDDHIYFNPLIFSALKENPFKAETRKLPVEFPYPNEHRIIVSLEIPQEYTVEELPQKAAIVLNDNDAIIQYVTAFDEQSNKVTVNFRFTLNRIIYSPQEYEELRNFFSHIATANTAQIVLKKKKA